MEIFTFRARSLQEALMLVRHELGPDASVIQTREISGKLFGWLGKPQIEVQASRDAKVMRRLSDGNAGPQDAVRSTSGLAVAERLPQAASQPQATADDRFDMTEEDVDNANELLGYAREDDATADDVGANASAHQPHTSPSIAW